MATKVYSFDDHRVILTHPDVGTIKLSDGGIGRVVVSYSGENSRLTNSADGGVVVNKIKNNSGSIALEVLQTSEANAWLKRYVNYLKTAPTKRYALGKLVITGIDGESTTCNGVVPQKMADIGYDAEAQSRSWQLLAADIVMK